MAALPPVPAELPAAGPSAMTPAEQAAVCAEVCQPCQEEAEAAAEEAEADDDVCHVCDRVKKGLVLLLCDGCDHACHLKCAGLRRVPKGDWFCRDCTAKRADEAEPEPEPEPEPRRRAPAKRKAAQPAPAPVRRSSRRRT